MIFEIWCHPKMGFKLNLEFFILKLSRCFAIKIYFCELLSSFWEELLKIKHIFFLFVINWEYKILN